MELSELQKHLVDALIEAGVTLEEIQHYYGSQEKQETQSAGRPTPPPEARHSEINDSTLISIDENTEQRQLSCTDSQSETGASHACPDKNIPDKTQENMELPPENESDATMNCEVAFSIVQDSAGTENLQASKELEPKNLKSESSPAGSPAYLQNQALKSDAMLIANICDRKDLPPIFKRRENPRKTVKSGKVTVSHAFSLSALPEEDEVAVRNLINLGPWEASKYIQLYLQQHNVPQKEVVQATRLNQSHLSQHLNRGTPMRHEKRIILYNWFVRKRKEMKRRKYDRLEYIVACEAPDPQEYEQHVGDKRTHPPEDYAEEGDVISSKKSGRFRWGVSSLTILHKAYEKCNNPSRLEREKLALECNGAELRHRGISDGNVDALGQNVVTEMRVYNWFANKRKELLSNGNLKMKDDCDTKRIESDEVVATPPTVSTSYTNSHPSPATLRRDKKVCVTKNSTALSAHETWSNSVSTKSVLYTSQKGGLGDVSGVNKQSTKVSRSATRKTENIVRPQILYTSCASSACGNSSVTTRTVMSNGSTSSTFLPFSITSLGPVSNATHVSTVYVNSSTTTSITASATSHLDVTASSVVDPNSSCSQCGASMKMHTRGQSSCTAKTEKVSDATGYLSTQQATGVSDSLSLPTQIVLEPPVGVQGVPIDVPGQLTSSLDGSPQYIPHHYVQHGLSLTGTLPCIQITPFPFTLNLTPNLLRPMGSPQTSLQVPSVFLGHQGESTAIPVQSLLQHPLSNMMRFPPHHMSHSQLYPVLSQAALHEASHLHTVQRAIEPVSINHEITKSSATRDVDSLMTNKCSSSNSTPTEPGPSLPTVSNVVSLS